MLDFRMQTLLELCETMNYRKAAERLNMTQPAVTQHIQYLERKYGCKLFEYDKHHLKKTDYCTNLERKVRAALYLENTFKEEIKQEKEQPLKIGVTKTIAEFVVPDMISQYLEKTKGDFTLRVENTQELLHMIDHVQLDFALVEGFFDKQQFGYRLFKKENFFGICAKTHPFAGKAVTWEEIVAENLILRESGSGTRTIFEDLLKHHSHTLEEFRRILCISHFSIIKRLVAGGKGITFAYESILQQGEELRSFSIKGVPVRREFNYVFLKGIEIEERIKWFETMALSEK